jgi:hypothetical protein
MRRALAIAALLLGTAAAFSTPAGAESLCVHAHVNVNGTAQGIDQCLP